MPSDAPPPLLLPPLLVPLAVSPEATLSAPLGRVPASPIVVFESAWQREFTHFWPAGHSLS